MDEHRLDGRSFAPVGWCIYCGATSDLTREHILPYGLGGTAVLQKSSCKACAAATGDVERRVLRVNLRALRVKLGLPSRSKHEGAPANYTVRVRRGSIWEVVQVPSADYPVLAGFPRFATPGAVSGQPCAGAIVALDVPAYAFGRPPEDLARQLGADELQFSETQDPVAFARMIAKVAYAYAVAVREIEVLDGPSPVLPAILGETDDIGKWVGTLTPMSQSRTGTHWLGISRDEARGLLVGEVQFWADADTPSYGVVLGALADDLVPTTRWIPDAPRRPRGRPSTGSGRVIEVTARKTVPRERSGTASGGD